MVPFERQKDVHGNLRDEERGRGCTIEPIRDSLSAIGHVRVFCRSCQHRSTEVVGRAARELDIQGCQGTWTIRAGIAPGQRSRQ